MARANLIKAIAKLKRLILRRPVGFPWGYDLQGLTLFCGANEEVVRQTLRGMAECGCIELEELGDNPPYHVRIICLPAAKDHRCREIGATNIQGTPLVVRANAQTRVLTGAEAAGQAVFDAHGLAGYFIEAAGLIADAHQEHGLVVRQKAG